MKKIISKILVLTGVAIAATLLSGCGTLIPIPAEAQKMTATSGPINIPELRTEKIQNVEVSGGQSTNPLFTSNIGDPEFKEALEKSLSQAGFFKSTKGRYSVSAKIVDEDTPYFGFDFQVTEKVHYIVRDLKTERDIMNKVVVASATATTTEAFFGVERLRIAKEKAMKANIEKFLREMIAAFQMSRRKKS